MDACKATASVAISLEIVTQLPSSDLILETGSSNTAFAGLKLANEPRLAHNGVSYEHHCTQFGVALRNSGNHASSNSFNDKTEAFCVFYANLFYGTLLPR